jgi:hypothetical protein
MKKHKYYGSATFTGTDGRQHGFMSQVYQVGIYCIFDGDAAQQSAYQTPAPLVKLCKALQKDADAGKIKDLQFGRPLTVAQVDGFWKEIED